MRSSWYKMDAKPHHEKTLLFDKTAVVVEFRTRQDFQLEPDHVENLASADFLMLPVYLSPYTLLIRKPSVAYIETCRYCNEDDPPKVAVKYMARNPDGVDDSCSCRSTDSCEIAYDEGNGIKDSKHSRIRRYVIDDELGRTGGHEDCWADEDSENCHDPKTHDRYFASLQEQGVHGNVRKEEERVTNRA